jgi:hypothetical protein
MKYVSHLLLLAATAVVSVGVSHLIASRGEADGRNLARRLLFEMRRSEALAQRSAQILRSLEIKKVVIDDLIADRLTLREAIEAFRQANALIENNSDGLVATYHTALTENELFQQVLAWTRARLGEDPWRAKEILQRLEEERTEQSCVEEKGEGRVGTTSDWRSPLETRCGR